MNERLDAILAEESYSPELKAEAFELRNTLNEFLTRRSVWIVGGDGWAYDIGFGGE